VFVSSKPNQVGLLQPLLYQTFKKKEYGLSKKTNTHRVGPAIIVKWYFYIITSTSHVIKQLMHYFSNTLYYLYDIYYDVRMVLIVEQLNTCIMS